ncbi:MAG: TonB-dependent receptor [Bacteroidota bacterium]
MYKKLLLLILFGGCWLSISAQDETFYPPVTIQQSNITVGKVIKLIHKQSGIDISYKSSAINKRQKIDYYVKQASVEACMEELSKKIPIRYIMLEGQVVLKKAEKQALPSADKKPKKFTISGFISDKITGGSLLGAAVFFKGSSIGMYTNEFGFFSITAEAGEYTFVCFHYGHKQKVIPVRLNRDIRQDISLETLSYDLPEVVIDPEQDNILDEPSLDVMELSGAQLQALPEFAGEPGIVNGLQSLPGLKTHSDGSAYYYSRGGERDQNLIVIDDAPIYNPSHLFGLYSIFIPDFAKSVSVYKGDMPASMGDRLSSIVSIRTKEGNLNKITLSGAANPFVNRLSLEGPFIRGRSSLFVTLRQSNIDWLYKRANPNFDIGFSDFQLKWNAILNENNRIYFTTIQSADEVSSGNNEANRTRLNWGSSANTLRWNHIFSPKLFSNTTLYSGTFTNSFSIPPNLWKAELGMLSLKMDFSYFHRPSLTFKFGGEVQGYFTNPGTLTRDSSRNLLPSIRTNASRKTIAYGEIEWRKGDKWQVKGGLRLVNWLNLGPTVYFDFDSTYQVKDTIQAPAGGYNRYVRLDPRANVSYAIDPSSQLKLSMGIYHQYLQMISHSSSPFTTMEIWLPASPNIKPQSSLHASLGYTKSFERPMVDMSASLYYKKSYNQIDLTNHSVTYLNPLIEGELRFGESISYGLELFVQKELGKWTGWASYALSRVMRQTDGINGGRPYRAFQDRPHDFTLSLQYQAKPRISLSGYLTIFSGSTFSSPTGFFTFNNQTVPIFGERNNDRLPAYQRLDLAIKFQLHKREEARFKHDLTLSVNNVLFHKNVYAVKFNKLSDIDQGTESLFDNRVQANFLTESRLSSTQVFSTVFFPSLTYRFSF